MATNFESIPWLGGLALIVSSLPGMIFLAGSSVDDDFSIPAPSSSKHSPHLLHIKLPLSLDFAALSIGVAKDQISLSVDPVRPDSHGGVHRFLIRLGQSKQMKRVELPARLDLEFGPSGVLQISEATSAFWLDCRLTSANILEASLFYKTPSGENVQQAQWTPHLQETPFQSADEFPETSPFRELAESRWWGHDLLAEKVQPGASIQRLEIGNPTKADLIDCSLSDWLIFKENKWHKCNSFESAAGLPLAHIKSVSPQALEIEGWNEASHVRLKLAHSVLPPLKIKPEELFSQLRVRSEKQVSCMLDKQCLVLRPGDWVLKTGLRWKTLRKKEERESVLQGKLTGDLFILDRIDAKGAAKNIVGDYYAPGRTQSLQIEYAQKTQKGSKKSR